MKFTEDNLNSYSQPLSDSEKAKCENAIGMVKDALKEIGFYTIRDIEPLYKDTYSFSAELLNIAGYTIRLLLQGSYANNTNVRTDSDVDIAVILENPNYIYTYSFKNDIESLLKKKFGSDVDKKNKSIKVHGNTYRKDVDVVPCFRINNYGFQGVEIHTDENKTIINYPEQHIMNGRDKNNNTNYYYKKMVRVMKKIHNIMIDQNIYEAKQVSSFGIESLMWNIPDSVYLEYAGYRKLFLFDNLLTWLSYHKNNIFDMKEANGIKKLCTEPIYEMHYQCFIDVIRKFFEYD